MATGMRYWFGEGPGTKPTVDRIVANYLKWMYDPPDSDILYQNDWMMEAERWLRTYHPEVWDSLQER